MLLDDALRTAWKQMAKEQRGPVQGAIVLCDEARTTAKHDGQGYQGSEWSKTLQACLVAWAATDNAQHAKTAIRFFTALLDDLEQVADGKGGDDAGKRDRGYAIRNLGPWTALAYDWLYPQLSPALREKARKRWAAWLGWYPENGYHPRDPGSNYHAGYLFAATLIAIAQAGEGDKALWRHVADQMWNTEMRAALAPGGILDGGDWPEGQQYGPLATASYSLAARIAKRAGIDVDISHFLEGVLKRHVYALAPGEQVFPGGDTESETPFVDVNVNTLNAVAFGDTTDESKRWARGELARLKLADAETLLFDALAAVGDKPTLIPRPTWPTWYFAPATAVVFARTRWDDRAVWFVAECQRPLMDHHAPIAGNFELVRGETGIVVDPTPYGSLSTLTSNAPTVLSQQLPKDYQPSQAGWAERVGWSSLVQTKSGVVAGRCDYADMYKFQEHKSDVPEALRDLVLLPNADGTDAVVVVIDRATAPEMHLRFRFPTREGAENSITTVDTSGGTPTRVSSTMKDCFGEGVKRGKCDAARFPVVDYRLVIPGPKPRAVHAIATSGKPAVQKLDNGVRVGNDVVAWGAVRAPKRGRVVTLDGEITAKADGDACAVDVKPNGKAAVVIVDDNCAVTADTQSLVTTPQVTKPGPLSREPRRSGCCNAETTPGSPFTLTIVAWFLARRGSRRRRRNL